MNSSKENWKVNNYYDDDHWHHRYACPILEVIKNKGSENYDIMINQTENIAIELFSCIRKHMGVDIKKRRVLDFGCGCGRPALLLRILMGYPTHGVDLDERGIDYLSSEIPNGSFYTNDYFPPLNYPDNHFDAIYSISIWTHLTPEMQISWLNEFIRILKPNGYAFISTAGLDVYLERIKSGVKGWEEKTEKDFHNNGMIYVPYEWSKGGKECGGIKGEYGLAVHSHEYIYKEWGKMFQIIDILPKYIASRQDLVVLKNGNCNIENL